MNKFLKYNTLRFLLFCISLFYSAQAGVSQSVTDSIQKVKWYTIEEAEKLNRVKPKKIFIDVYTDWCVWCKKMDQQTFSHPVIAKLLNDYFYPVKFNAETHDTVIFNGAKYICLNKTGKVTHPLAISLLGWRISYPSVVYFTERFEYLGAMPGYKTPQQLEVILNYIIQEKFRSTSLEEFEKTFKSQIFQPQ